MLSVGYGFLSKVVIVLFGCPEYLPKGVVVLFRFG